MITSLKKLVVFTLPKWGVIIWNYSEDSYMWIGTNKVAFWMEQFKYVDNIYVCGKKCYTWYCLEANLIAFNLYYVIQCNLASSKFRYYFHFLRRQTIMSNTIQPWFSRLVTSPLASHTETNFTSSLSYLDKYVSLKILYTRSWFLN